jgi:hypothetical protein
MIPAKLHRVLALTALMSSLALLPAQALGSAPRGTPRGIGLAERFERLEILAWSFLAGLFEKNRTLINPDGAMVGSPDTGGGH